MKNPITMLTCYFLKSNISLFDEFNLMLQRDEPLIHQLQTKCVQLVTDLLVRFVKQTDLKNEKNMLEVKYDERDNQKEDEELVLGVETKKYLQECVTSGTVTRQDKKAFYRSVRDYFVEACRYIILRFPLNREFLEAAEVVDISRRSTASFSSVLFFVERFRGLKDEVDLDKLEQEFLRYQIDELEGSNQERIDVRWSKMRDRYPLLSKIMLSILSVPHSNADSERIFSAVRRVQTEYRTSMDMPLLESLIVIKNKMNCRNESCYSVKFTEGFLARAKSSTYTGLKKASEEQNQEEDPIEESVLRLLAGKDDSAIIPDDMEESSVSQC